MRTAARAFAIRMTVAMMAVLAFALSAPAAENTDAMRLDALFAELSEAPSKPEADKIASEIWQIWMSPSDKERAERMAEIVTARSILSLERTLDLLDKLIADHPDYAEAWNRRATLNYEMGRYQASLDDISETLAREPRHFGALSGLALVHLSMGNRQSAKAAAERARDVHPFIAVNPPLSDLVAPRMQI